MKTKPQPETPKTVGKASSRSHLGERVPRLRFLGFDGSWEERKIGDLYSERSQRSEAAMELLSVTIADGVVPRNDLEGKDNSSEDKSNYKVVRVGDMVYNTMRMWQGASGVSSHNGIVSPAYTVLRDAATFDRRFVAALFKTELVINEFRKNSQGLTSDTWNLKYPQIATIKVCLPSIAEQHHIADCLALLDSRISKQRQLVDLLKKHKRGLIQALFADADNPMPSIRLAGFSGKWNVRKWGTLGSFTKGAPLTKADISQEGKPFVLYGELYTTYGEIIDSVVRKTKAEVSSEFLSRSGDVLVPTSGETAEEIATASCVMQTGVVLGGDLNIFRSSVLDGRFLAYVLRHKANREIARIAQGVSVVHVSATELKQLPLAFPSREEQSAIVSLLSMLDARINLIETSLEKAENIRTGLLQQLFV